MANVPTVVATEQLATVTKDLDIDSATALRAAFEEMFAQADEWVRRASSIRVTSEDQRHEMNLARESRLALRDIRVKADHTRKRLKEDSLRRGKAVDGIANVLKALIEPIEEHLRVQETFAERAEAGRRDALREARATALVALGCDVGVFGDLATMTLEQWSSTLGMAQSAHDQKIAEAKRAEEVRIEAERIAAEKREAERLTAIKAEAERVERQRVADEENARLRAEAARVEQERADERMRAKAKADADERDRQRERERVEMERAVERQRADAEAKEQRRLLAERDAEIAKERAHRERVELEAKAAESVRAEAKRTADLESEAMKAPAWNPHARPPPMIPDARGVVMTDVSRRIIVLFNDHQITPDEALSIIARLGGHMQGLLVLEDACVETPDAMNAEFSARVAEERERYLALVASRRESMS